MGKLMEKMKNARTKATSALMVAGVSATTAAATIAPAFANSGTNPFGNLFTTIGAAGNGLIQGIQGIVTPIAGAAAAYCLIMMVITKDQKKLESYKQWLISIVICVILLFAFPKVIEIAKNFGTNV